VRARYVVGADGSRSLVRSALGIAMRGSTPPLAGVTALVHAPLWALLGEHRYGIYATVDPGVECIFLPAGPGDRWAFGYLLDADTPGPRTPASSDLSERIRLAAGIPRLPLRIERTGSFSARAEIADRFRRGSAFLVGDAAHRVTPRGGTGLNTAIHSGHDLGWKLAWVLRGWADPAILDTYETERRAVAEHNIARSADPEGSQRPIGEELRVDLGGRIAHHWMHHGGRRVSTLDLAGPGLTLLTGPEAAPWRAAAAASGTLPVALHALDTMTARALGLRHDGAVLLRPDGVPAATWATRPGSQAAVHAAIGQAVATATGALSPALRDEVAVAA
jgi:putative polyketide hydroxylase